jgi:hypothetical protein
MVELHGRELTRREVAEHTGMLTQVAGVRLMTLGDGIERGNRMLEFRTGTGLRFTAMVDRALDFADLDYKGQSIGWHSPAGFRHPSLHDYEGEDGLAFVRSFSGLVATCGLDHTMGPAEVPADSYNYPGRKSVRHSLHGRVSLIPARLTGYGEAWDGDRCLLWAEGVVQQSTMFGEDLHLLRRIEAEVGGNAVRILDRVVNHGFYRTPHMFFYHVNVGWPLLEAGARYLAPIRDVLWASHAASYRDQDVGYRSVAAPRAGFREQVWEHDLAPDAAGLCPAAVVNDRLGLGFQVETRKDQLPCFYQWQNFQAGHYALGIEPSTHHILGEPAARERGEMIWLEHGESRAYAMTLRVLDGPAEIDAAAARIAAIAPQPPEDYPPPSDNFPPLGESR